mmetsp:Transcript_790/g.2636  ORF Transcript_790/g.2636 Transcript_790/m.2636 type:complete len:385 (+) Transcript_790:189-1343(+)
MWQFRLPVLEAFGDATQQRQPPPSRRRKQHLSLQVRRQAQLHHSQQPQPHLLRQPVQHHSLQLSRHHSPQVQPHHRRLHEAPRRQQATQHHRQHHQPQAALQRQRPVQHRHNLRLQQQVGHQRSPLHRQQLLPPLPPLRRPPLSQRLAHPRQPQPPQHPVQRPRQLRRQRPQPQRRQQHRPPHILLQLQPVRQAVELQPQRRRPPQPRRRRPPQPQLPRSQLHQSTAARDACVAPLDPASLIHSGSVEILPTRQLESAPLDFGDVWTPWSLHFAKTAQVTRQVSVKVQMSRFQRVAISSLIQLHALLVIFDATLQPLPHLGQHRKQQQAPLVIRRQGLKPEPRLRPQHAQQLQQPREAAHPPQVSRRLERRQQQHRERQPTLRR